MTGNPRESESAQGGTTPDAPSDRLERSLHRRGLTLVSLLGSSVALLGIGVFASDLCIGAISATLAPLVAVAMFFVDLMPPGAAALDAGLTRFARRVGLVMRYAAVICLLLGCVVVLQRLAVARMVSKPAVCASNIRGLMYGLAAYCRTHGDYPPGFADLLDEDSVTPKGLLCPWDGAADEAGVVHEGYSSYVYTPGRGSELNDHTIILVYERLPWSYGQFTWCCPPGYEVGFADGTVRWLSVEDMSEALARDAARRAAVGWPVARPLGRLPRPVSTNPASASTR